MTRYPLSDAMARFVAKTQAFAGTDNALGAQRRAYEQMCAAFTPARSPQLQVSDLQLARIPVRRYRPVAAAPAEGWPWLLYLHGGGWVVGGLNSHDFICCELAQALKATVVAVDYRLAPEHPYPAALDDCLAVWEAVRLQGQAWQLVRGEGLVMGDSAGGNLAAALCLALRDQGLPAPRAQVLIYPALGGAGDAPSRLVCSDAPLLSAVEVLQCEHRYVPMTARGDPLAMPLLAEDVRNLPPAFMAVAQFDPLHDDGVQYHRRLLADGGVSELYHGQGLVHGCLRGRHQVPEVDDLYDAMLGYIKDAVRET